jgi:hypothetical protein
MTCCFQEYLCYKMLSLHDNYKYCVRACACVCVCTHAYTYTHTHTHTYINKLLSWISEYVSHYSTVMNAESLPDVTELVY